MALANVMFGLERFVVLSASSMVGGLVLLGATIVALRSGDGLPGLGTALLAQQSVLLVIRAGALFDVLVAGRPRLAPWAQVRAIAVFSAKLQVAALTVLINGQSDRVLAALVAPAAVVGQLGVAGQVAEAGRFVAGALLQPVTSRLSSLVALDDCERVDREYRRLSRRWIVGMIGATAVGLGVLQPLILSWLGPGYGQAVLFGAVLVVAYGFNILTGIGSAYLRATAAVGIEARAGLITVGLNLLFTIPLALIAGALGVAMGTLAANVLGTAWFFWRVHRVVPLARPPLGSALRVAALAAAAGATTLALGSLAASALPRFVAMAPVGLAAAACLAGYLALTLGVPARLSLRLGGTRRAGATPPASPRARAGRGHGWRRRRRYSRQSRSPATRPRNGARVRSVTATKAT